ncbi:MAG TPA: DUF1800 domain-containing protein [Candidatus Acidoferrales bacterium]|jgi:uncharacterized protein (DUF1800 family)|nr:DUF1800 domain-containing protein [Candidatus Acidoferrales bacterium]
MTKNKQRFDRPKKRLDAPGAGFLAALLVVALAVPCAQAGKDKTAADQPPAQLGKRVIGKLPITELTEDEAILHALNRLAYGPRPGDVERVRRMGLDKWIEQQLNPASINDSAVDARLAGYSTLKMSSQQLVDAYPQPNQAAKQQGITTEEFKQQRQQQARQQLQQTKDSGDVDPARLQLARVQGPQRIIAELTLAKLTRAMYSERQLNEVMADFWFNHFNVFAGKGADKWLLTSYERDSIRPHTLGKFQDLLLATAQSPAMLFYLDNWLSADPVASERMQQELAQRRRRFQGMFGGAKPQQKQDRGLNENYGREVMELHTLGVDGGYTQQDVIQMARCLTGWTVRAPRRNPEFFFDERIHAQGPKVVLGRTFNYGGMRDGEEALRMLARHPSTAKFISTELARHFVADAPPPALVDRMAQSFLLSDGDIRIVMHTMIYSPEFWSRAAYRSKVKTPFELAASTARALGADVSVPMPVAQWVGRMGEPLYLCQPPTGYSDKAETWVNTGALLNRLNFALTLSSGRMPGTSVDLATVLGADASTDPHAALSRSLEMFLGGQVAPQTRSTLEARLDDPQILQARLDDPVKQVNKGLIAGLVLGSPEFQRR